MKTWKRNAIVATVLVFVCAGIYLNWLYGDGKAAALTDTLDAEKVMDDAALVMNEEDDSMAAAAEGLDVQTGSDSFAQMRLSRQESRDQAIELLQEAIAYAGEDEDVSASSQQLDAIVAMSLSEAQIESLIISKGYSDCVAYMTDDGISVAVAAPEEGLKEEDVALLTDIITGQSDYAVSDIRIIEVN